ncbi:MULTISPECIES: flagellar biosynthesis protein FlhF [unclassified Rhizobacter]|uniref:flagellar biosynthesis protein FlhF n=1 Tax=unclassified Rhizobacter TaxID=2640088 RepID=UPI0006FCD800|nr:MULTISPECIES: flagellar biosynthesis protein FlhF [unclassified Rhizobacter]KQU71336.1 flagellar biosynthesis protein FlhF [Rhizobacter sp. Root29]KQW10618.1 flagellar biosynthesis protein FlhF [Rhizobacter sp. Root1238]KRB24694.1 flagellar biosynthesis protein FlhF [Rhizobacter sp. Root16D2]
MNVKRFTARTSRDALTLVRQAFGEDAVVLSTKPCAEGVEVLAMAPESVQQIERLSAAGPIPPSPPVAKRAATPRAPAARPAPAPQAAPAPAMEVTDDVARLSMSTLSFQDYVRERMLKRRQAALQQQHGRDNEPSFMPDDDLPLPTALEQRLAERQAMHPAPTQHTPMQAVGGRSPALREPPVLREEIRVQQQQAAAAAQAQAQAQAHAQALADARAQAAHTPAPVPAAPVVSLADARSTVNASARRDQQDMMNELRSMKGLIEERFGALAFMEKLQRQPAQAMLIQKLLDSGFSPALIRKLAESLPNDVGDETAWAANILERNLITGENDAALEDQGGVYALIGSTGVGKTTSAAKIAAAFATKHGAANLGLITLDAYRVGAHEQLRAYGRILGVPVHTAHDRASLEDLLELLAAKKMVLIDTAGMAQRDSRTRELLDMLAHRSIQKLLVVNAAAQGETIEDVMVSYRAAACKGIVLSKLDEAVKLAPALDALIRHKLKVVGVANGQRVPEDWHRLSAHALVHRALRANTGTAYRMDADDVNLIFTARQPALRTRGSLHA